MQLISQMAKRSDTPVHTIRYYERYGLFKGKKDTQTTSNNYTWYDEEVLDKLELIKEAKAIGFSLAEIKKLVDAWYGKRLSVEKKKEILLTKSKEIDDKIAHLKNMKKLLAEAVKYVENGAC